MKKITSVLVLAILVLTLTLGSAFAHCKKPHAPVPPPAGGEMN